MHRSNALIYLHLTIFSQDRTLTGNDISSKSKDMSHSSSSCSVTNPGSPSIDDKASKAILWALALNGAFLIVEAVGGWLTNSLALLSDAAHMANDVGILLLALGASWLARRSGQSHRGSRCHRIEVIGGLISGIALLAAGGWIVMETTERLGNEAPAIPGWPMLVVGIIGLLINLGSAWYLHRAGSDSLNVRGALLHMLADAAGSLGVIVAALLMMVGIRQADAAVSLVIAALVTWASYSLIRDTLRELWLHRSSSLDPAVRVGNVESSSMYVSQTPSSQRAMV